MSPNWPTPGHQPTAAGAWKSPAALVAHLHTLLAMPPGRHQRAVVRTRLELPAGWWLRQPVGTSVDVYGFRGPGQRWHTALGQAWLCPVRQVRYLDAGGSGNFRPHPEDLQAVLQWLDQVQVSCPVAAVAGFPLRAPEGGWVAPLRLWVPRLWLIDDPAEGAAGRESLQVEVALVFERDRTAPVIAAEVDQLLSLLTADEVPEPTPLQLQRESQADVGQALQCLDEQPVLRKVVLAWPRHWSGGGAIGRVWQHLREQRGDAWCAFGQLPEGEFAFASPELLIEGRHGGLRSLALAGTLVERSAPPASPAAVMAVEHQLVVDYLTDSLAELGAEARPERQQVRTAGSLRHLATPVTVTDRGGLSALQAALWLHPTPALLGLPRPQALQLLAELEPEPRGWYGGFAGLLSGDGSGDGELAVLLRGAAVQDGGWLAWAGAGLVRGADVEAERREILNKHQALVEGLGLQPAAAAS